MRRTVFAALAFIGFFALLEGASSVVVASIEIYNTTRNLPAESLHTRHDPELGWVNRPNLRLKDFFGEGRNLSTNSQGFRGVAEYAPEADRTRILCTGDSFTFGYGVDDEDAWPRVLERSGVETVNIGQGAYGPGQAFLLARRVWRELDYDVHLFSVITHDFTRMVESDYLNRPKPLVGVRDGRVEAVNAPVGTISVLEQWWLVNGPGTVLRNVRLLDLAARVKNAGREEAAPGGEYETPDLTSHEVIKTNFGAILRELAHDAAARDARVVMVYLPMHLEYERSENLIRWQKWMAAEADAAGVEYWDPGEDWRRMPVDGALALYIGPDGRRLERRGDLGHFNERGNRFVAEWIAEALER